MQLLVWVLLALKTVLASIGFKVFQFVIGAPFTLVILGQMAAAAASRFFWEPQCLTKVAELSCSTPSDADAPPPLLQRGDSPAQLGEAARKPMLLFPEPKQGVEADWNTRAVGVGGCHKRVLCHCARVGRESTGPPAHTRAVDSTLHTARLTSTCVLRTSATSQFLLHTQATTPQPGA